MKRERCFLIDQTKKLDFFPHLLSLFILRKFFLQKHKHITQKKWLKLSGGAKGALFAFGKGRQALAETGSPQDCISLVQHEDFLSFSATQLCSEQCRSTEKNYPNPGFDFFPSTTTPALNPCNVQQKNGRWTIESQGPFQCCNSMFPQQLVENR